MIHFVLVYTTPVKKGQPSESIRNDGLLSSHPIAHHFSPS